jgi:signal transduction histidine kinase
MSSNGVRPLTPAESLVRLRRRLTAWYGVTFFAILALLGIGMFATITRRFDLALDASLRDATAELIATVRERGPVEAVRDLRIPDRTLIITDSSGTPVAGAADEAWLRELARRATAQDSAHAVHRPNSDRILRGEARAFHLASGGSFVAIAVADEIELEDRYADLIAAFGGAALAAVVLVAVGGWLLARKSTKPVEQSIAHMRRFMADAAHELRTPLTVVRSRAEVALQRSRAPEDYVSALHGIERETTRVSRIVEDLLMLARADAGERPIERRRVFLDDLALDAAEAARVIAERRQVRVEVGEFEEAAIVGDAQLLRQLALILLDNAVKFTGPSGVVRVSVRATASLVTLTVADTGVGIPSDQLPHVFERFYRGDPARSRQPATTPETGVEPTANATHDSSQGAGLGLAIAQWIAEQHAGSIRIDSQAGRGTRVVVQLPAATADVVSSS